MSTELEAQLSQDLSHLEGLGASQREGLLGLALDFLLDGRGDFQAGLGEFAETHRVDAKTLKPLVRGLLVFLQGGIRDGLNVAQIEARATSLGLSPEVAAIVGARWQQSSSQMVTSVLARTVAANRLVDMDWSFGVTASSDDCDQVGKTFLQLKLTLDRGDGSGTGTVLLELSLDQFFAFLSSMEFIQAYVADV